MRIGEPIQCLRLQLRVSVLVVDRFIKIVRGFVVVKVVVALDADAIRQLCVDFLHLSVKIRIFLECRYGFVVVFIVEIKIDYHLLGLCPSW